MSFKGGALHSLAWLMGSEKYNDLKFECQGEEFPVHRAIVCTQSPVIAAACDGGFQEATTKVINMDKFDAETVGRMVTFMYEEEYSDGTEERGSGDTTQPQIQPSELSLPVPTKVDNLCAHTPETTNEILRNNVRVNAIADYYDVPPLKELANRKMQLLLDVSWWAEGFCGIVEDVLNWTSDIALHNIMSFTTARHIEEMLELDDFNALKVKGDFFIGVLRYTVASGKTGEEFLTGKLQVAESRLKKTELCLKFAEDSCEFEKSEKLSESARADRIIENIDYCRKTLFKTKTCRNVRCEAEFDCYIEQGGQLHEPKYLLRCGRCDCRHGNN